jgi:hypothetical protein
MFFCFTDGVFNCKMQTLYHTEDLLDRLDDINELFWMIHLLAYEEAI